MSDPDGKVYLVGAGPGDPGLLTIRGLHLLRLADVVVHDRLIGNELLAEVKHGAELINVAKRPGEHRARQEEINHLLVDRARSGKLVVRLKGGDPFIFGRGFEELTFCREAGVSCNVVPGVSSAFAGPAAAGIPITKRNTVRSVGVVTAHMVGGDTIDLATCRGLVAIDTLIILMGRQRLSDVALRLIEAGKSPSTPVACVEWATTPAQRTVVATLATISESADRAGLASPVVTVVGEVALEADQAGKSIGAPLTRKRIVIARPSAAYVPLQETLSMLGATTMPCSLMRFAPIDNSGALDESVRQLHQYDWIILSSRHAVRALWRAIDKAKLDARSLAGCKIMALGDGTSRALKRIGLSADEAPSRRDAPSVIQTLTKHGVRRVLMPAAEHQSTPLIAGLAQAGIPVDAVAGYRVIEAVPSDVVLDVMRDGVDALVLTNPACARRFGALSIDMSATCVLCAGLATADAAIAAGLPVTATTSGKTTDSIASALVDHFAKAAMSV